MSLTVTRSRVKDKCGITDSSYDSLIDTMILEQIPVLEYQLSAQALADMDSGIQATLNLGATEIVCAELLAQRLRELGAIDIITIGDLRIQPTDAKHAENLRTQGYARLAPFLKSDTYADSGVGLAMEAA